VALKNLFDSWSQHLRDRQLEQQWLLSKWEVLEGVEWPALKVELMIRHISEGLQLDQNCILADLGCGGGWITEQLRSQASRIVALDFSFPMLSVAKRLNPTAPLVCAEIGQLPFQEGAFDRVLCYFVFINFQQEEYIARALKEIMRVLKKGGRALIGQLPDRNGSSHYDQDKLDYVKYCENKFPLGQNYSDVYKIPIKLYDRQALILFLKKQRFSFQVRPSFNPFYRPGQPKTVDWRFDLILEKK
jgi:SAM-dependent methyltransferase